MPAATCINITLQSFTLRVMEFSSAVTGQPESKVLYERSTGGQSSPRAERPVDESGLVV
jgi:hypothetical protein